MTIRFASVRLSAVAAACAVLSACGGGGGDGASVAALADITASNYEAMASELADTTDAAVGLNQLPQTTLINVSGSTGLSLSLSARALEAVQRSFGTERAQAVVTRSGVCETPSGTSTVALDDANNSGTTDAGDSVTLTDNACLRDGVTTTGSIRIRLNATPRDMTVNSTSYSVDATVTLSNYRVVDGTDTTVFSGDMRFQGLRTAYRTGRDEVSISRLDITTIDGSIVPADTLTSTMAGVSAVVVYTPTEMRNSFAGDITSASFDDRRISLSTLVPFTLSYDVGADPSAGQAKVTGASGRSVTLTVLNAVQVQVSADLNGDGDTTDDADRTVTRNWSELY